MFGQGDQFGFHREVMDLVDGFIRDYSERRGAPGSDVDKALIASFALGAVREDLDDVWRALDSAAVFDGASVKGLFEPGGYGGETESQDEAREQLLASIRSRGWVPQP